jgi:PhzF family phenazine biosynthesis protein
VSIPIFIVDSFTDQPFRGNPAGVCLPETELSEERMLAIARELGLSETAFVVGERIRYFSPKQEIPLCGHATLAAAKVLFARQSSDAIRFLTVQGIELMVTRVGEWLSMAFPLYETRPAEAPAALLAALGIENTLRVAYNEETRILLIEIASTDALRAMAPDFIALEKSHTGIDGVLVTAQATDGYDFHSRYFWPWSGTNEDPVTGGTHTFLAPYWATRLRKNRLKSFQSSARTGFMDLELQYGRVLIKGRAVPILEGHLHV